MKGINLAIQEFKERIADCINRSGLPPGVVQIILNEYQNQVQTLNDQAIAQERKEEEEGEKTNGSENSSSNH